jgi:hypothetical protein
MPADVWKMESLVMQLQFKHQIRQENHGCQDPFSR